MAGRRFDLKELGRRLKAARLEAGLTQKEAAGGDYTAAYVSQMERGVVQPSLESLACLAFHLGRPLAHFFSDHDHEKNQITARVCLLRGWQLVKCGRCEEGRPYLDQALSIARTGGDLFMHGTTLLAFGDLSLGQNQTLEAIDHYTRALEIFEKAGEQRGGASSCLSLGILYLESGNPLLGVQYLRRAKDALPTGDALEPEILAALSRCYDLLGEEALAASFSDQSLAACRQRLNWAGEVDRRGEAAVRAWTRGQQREALLHAERAFHILSHRDRMATYASLLRDGAKRLAAGDAPVKAEQLLQESLSTCRAIDDQTGMAWSWLLLGSQSLDQGKLDRARTQGELARDLAGSSGDQTLLAHVHRLLGRVEVRHGDSTVARHHWEESARLYSESGDEANLAQTYADLGEIHLKEGNQGQALEYFRKAASRTCPR